MERSAETHRFRILGMCAEEVIALKRELVPLVGDEQLLVFDLLQGKLTVSSPRTDLTAEQIVQAVAKAGLKAEPWADPSGQSAAKSKSTFSFGVWLVVVSGLAATLGLLVHMLVTGSMEPALGTEGTSPEEILPIVSCLLFVLAIASGMWLVLPKAWNSARHFRPDMNVLMVIAVIGAILINQWLEAATVAFLFALSNLLESWSIGRARRAIASLLTLAPPEVHVRRPDGTEITVLPDQLVIGTRFMVRPGERIPLDGKVVAGASDVNQAPITGESRPIDKTVGEPVFAGTINGNGALEVVSTATATRAVASKCCAKLRPLSSNSARSRLNRDILIWLPTAFLHLLN